MYYGETFAFVGIEPARGTGQEISIDRSVLPAL